VKECAGITGGRKNILIEDCRLAVKIVSLPQCGLWFDTISCSFAGDRHDDVAEVISNAEGFEHEGVGLGQ